jgi:hypothetical protein
MGDSMFIATSWSLAEADISCFIRQAQFGKANLNTVARQAVTGRANQTRNWSMDQPE